MVSIVALVHLARSSRGRRRWGFVVCTASIVLVLASGAALLIGLDDYGSRAAGADWVECGRPMLSRPDIDLAANQAGGSIAARYCQHELASRRTFALLALLSALAAAVGGALLLLPFKSGHRLAGASNESPDFHRVGSE